MVEDIIELLGGQRVFGKIHSGKFGVADAIENGLQFVALDNLKLALELSDVEAADTLGISQKTISRMRKTPRKKLGKVPSDRIYRLAHIFVLAHQVFEDMELARDWLHSPQVGLNNRIPLDLADTEVGSREIINLLGRIEHGVLS